MRFDSLSQVCPHKRPPPKGKQAVNDTRKRSPCVNRFSLEGHCHGVSLPLNSCSVHRGQKWCEQMRKMQETEEKQERNGVPETMASPQTYVLRGPA